MKVFIFATERRPIFIVLTSLIFVFSFIAKTNHYCFDVTIEITF